MALKLKFEKIENKFFYLFYLPDLCDYQAFPLNLQEQVREKGNVDQAGRLMFLLCDVCCKLVTTGSSNGAKKL